MLLLKLVFVILVFIKILDKIIMTGGYDENENKSNKEDEEINNKLNGLTSVNINLLTKNQKLEIINLMDFTQDKNVNHAYKYLSSNEWNMEASLNNYIMDKQVFDQISPNDLKRMSSSEQILIAQNASKRQYFMSSTNCRQENIANEYLIKANFDADVAVLNYRNDEKNKLQLGQMNPLYRMNTQEQMAMFKQMDKDTVNTNNSKYIGHMSMSEAVALMAGDVLDHRDTFGLYRSGEI
eukprot:UN05803